MKKITTIAELMEIIESGEYNYYGLRGASAHDLDVMDRGYLDCSYNWIDGEQTDEMLNGSCAIGIGDYLSEKEIARRYNRIKDHYNAAHGTETILLIADNSQEYGDDEDEVVLGSNGCGADVIAIVEI